MSADRLVITNNTIQGCWAGINVRSGGVLITSNVISDSVSYGIYCYNRLENLQILDNQVTNTGDSAILVYAPVSAATVIGDVAIRGNDIATARYGIRVSPDTTGAIMRNVSITDNQIYNTAEQGIYVQVGSATQAADGFYGTVSHNVVDTVNWNNVARAAIELVNAKYVTIIGNVGKSATLMTNAVRVRGAGAIGFHESLTISLGHTSAAVAIDSDVQVNHKSTGLIQGAGYTIATGAIVLRNYVSGHLVVVDTEAAAAADDLDTITGGETGQLIVIRSTSAARVITVKDGTNIKLSADMVLDSTSDTLTLMNYSSVWNEIGRANNG
jgi:Fe-S cluster assembly scaffold protein SufB